MVIKNRPGCDTTSIFNAGLLRIVTSLPYFFPFFNCFAECFFLDLKSLPILLCSLGFALIKHLLELRRVLLNIYLYDARAQHSEKISFIYNPFCTVNRLIGVEK